MSSKNPRKTAQKTSKKRKTIEDESTSSSPTRHQPKRIAKEDSELARATRNLWLSASYGLEDLPSSASKFKIRDMEALKVNFLGASSQSVVIPKVPGTRYIASTILSEPNTNTNTYNLNIV